MLNGFFNKIISFGSVIPSIVDINTQKNIIDATSNTNNEFNTKLFVTILLILVLVIAIILIVKRSQRVSRWFTSFFKFLRIIFFGGKLNKGTTKDALDEVIEFSGYAYDSKQDVFYSRMDAWQRTFGYSRLYDEAAAPMGMIIDCEPIYFQYGGKKWLIEFWKGQYDLTTGCEIGIYTTEGTNFDIFGSFNGTFYKSASNLERLKMSFTLKKNNQILFKRKDKHWWLTGFRLGEFSQPSDLTMDIIITLKNEIMRNEFIKGLKNANYSDEEFILNGNTISLKFSKTHVQQPTTRNKETDRIIQRKNKYLCDIYQNITKGYSNMPDKLKAVQEKAPDLYKEILNIGKPKKLFKMYEDDNCFMLSIISKLKDFFD